MTLNFKNIDLNIILIVILSSIPLVISGTIDSLNINFQRLIIQNELSIKEVGIYGSLTTFMVSGQVLIAAIMSYFLPILNECVKERNIKKFKQILIFVSTFSFSFGIILCYIVNISGKFILPLLFTSEYADYVYLSTLIMFVGSLWYLAGSLNYCILALNLYKSQMLSIIISFFTMIILSIILIESHFINGAAYALMGSMLIRVILFIFTITRKLRSIKYEKLH